MKPKFLLYWFFIVSAIISCKTQKQIQKESLEVKATTESSKETTKETTTLQEIKSTRLDTSNTNTESDYERQTLIRSQTIVDSNGKVLGNVTYTLINEKGKKNKTRSKKSQQSTNGKSTIKENEKSAGKKSSAVNIVETAKNKNKTTTGGWPLKLLSITAILLAIITIIIIVKRKIKTLLCIAMLLFVVACEQKVEVPKVEPTQVTQTQPVKLTLLDFARKELGITEIPHNSNWGKDVEKYLQSTGINYPAPWCMSYIYWTVQEYCNQYNYKNPLYKTAHVLTEWRKCKLLRVTTPQEGDIFIIINKDGTGHCGFVERIAGNRIYTIEGNSNNDGSRNGYEICRKTNGRPIKEITGFIRPVFKE